MITVVTAIASMLLVAQVAAADAVQDQLQLMEQRMAEMEDRLQATSDELQTAKATVNEQRSVLSTNGLIEDEGLRSGVGSFFDMVDVSGVAAASYNHRLIKADDPT
jgi:opacity protein-like surface antigen